MTASDPTSTNPPLASGPPRYDMATVGPDLVRAAEALYAECQRAIDEKRIDARSPIGDATLDYHDAREDLRLLCSTCHGRGRIQVVKHHDYGPDMGGTDVTQRPCDECGGTGHA